MTLPELLVVLTIVAIMSAVAVPAFIQLGAFSRDELNRSARTVMTLLKAAQQYAITYNVRTAVVYGLDNYQPVPASNTPDNYRSPIADSVDGATVRVFMTAALMYQLPASSRFAGNYVFAPRREGEFNVIDGGMVIFLRDPNAGELYYRSDLPRFQHFEPTDTSGVDRLYKLGLSNINVYLDGSAPFTPTTADDSEAPEPFPAHVFLPSGALEVPTGNQSEIKERYVLQIGPIPSESTQVRLKDPDQLRFSILQDQKLVNNLQYIPIEVFRSTGRIRIGERS